MSDLNPYESPSITREMDQPPIAPPLPTEPEPLWKASFRSGKYWAIFLGTALIGVCIIVWMVNAIIPYIQQSVGRARVNPDEVAVAQFLTIIMLGLGIPLSFIAGAIVGAMRYVLESFAKRNSSTTREIENSERHFPAK